MEMDLDIICKQTNSNREIARDIYIKNKQDITDTICELEGYVESPKEKKKLSEAQEKIKELREIVENKDKIMDSIKEASQKN